MGKATKGSQMWLQQLINNAPDLINAAIVSAGELNVRTPIEWKSPLADDEYAEYMDEAALRKAGIESLVIPLDSFWPRRGPVWDAIGIADGKLPIFVEAKAHIAEMGTPGTKASFASKERITSSLIEMKRYYKIDNDYDWSGLFYQYANRLAHHYYLEKLNGIKSYLAFVYFINAKDVNGPKSKAEWQAAIQLLHIVLGVKEKTLKDVLNLFIDCEKIRGS